MATKNFYQNILIGVLLVSLVLLNNCSEFSNQSALPRINESTTHDKNIKLNTKENAELMADRFARYIEQKDYEKLWELIIPDLQSKKNKESFSRILTLDENFGKITSMRLNRISIGDETTAYAYFDGSGGVFTTQLPAVKMNFINNSWRFDALNSIFNQDEQDMELKSFLRGIADLQIKNKKLLLEFIDTTTNIHFTNPNSYPDGIFEKLVEIKNQHYNLVVELRKKTDNCPNEFKNFCNGLIESYSLFGKSFETLSMSQIPSVNNARQANDYMNQAADATRTANNELSNYSVTYLEYYKNLLNENPT